QAESLAGDLLPDPEFGARDWRAVHRVLAQDARSRIEELHAASFNSDQRAESEFGFGIRDVALTRNQSHQCSVHSGESAIIPCPGAGINTNCPIRRKWLAKQRGS